jgi:hypothetical protein
MNDKILYHMYNIHVEWPSVGQSDVNNCAIISDNIIFESVLEHHTANSWPGPATALSP